MSTTPFFRGYENFDARLNSLASLKDGWLNGEGTGISEQTVQNAKLVLKAIFENSSIQIPRPTIGPTEEGGIDIQWTNIFCTILPSNELEVWIKNIQTTETTTYNISSEMEKIVNVQKSLFKEQTD